tara:strand:- start:1130 stop:1414 length:285 start_codon:yes stop_codon:yes gene_type:complete
MTKLAEQAEVQVEEKTAKKKRTRNTKPSTFMIGREGKDGLYELTEIAGAKSAADVKSAIKQGTHSDYPDGKYVILLKKDIVVVRSETLTVRSLN